MAQRKSRSRRKRALSVLGICLTIILAMFVFYSIDRDAFLASFNPAVSPAQSVSPGAKMDTPSTKTPKPTKTPETTAGGKGPMEVYVLDVGQGDCIFLKSPSGKTMLVDASESDEFDTIRKFLSGQGVTKLDVVVATHPHSDHIGSMAKVINAYDIGAFYMSPVTHTSSTFEKMLDALDKKEVKCQYAIAGKNAAIAWDDAVTVSILSPFENVEYENLNDWSIILRVKYGENAILLTGDAEMFTEKTALSKLSSSAFEADVLKLGHHGSSSSTSREFLKAVNPQIAIASLGAGNSYGHPHQETINILKEFGIPLYRTDESGTICLTFTGKTVKISTEK